ncbi:MAG: AI-2E family transporter [Fusobacteriaceae bacterium]
MWQDKSKKGIFFKIFIVFVLVVLVQSFLQNGEELKKILTTITGYITPFIYAVFLAIILHPLSVLLENKLKMKRITAIIIAIIVVIISIFALFGAIIPGVVDSVKDISGRTSEIENKLQEWAVQVIDFLKIKGIIALEPGKIKELFDKYVQGNAVMLTGLFKSLSLNILSVIIVFGQILIGLIIAIFFILDREYFEKLIYNTVYIFSDENKAEETINFLDQVRKIFLNYLWGKTLVSAVVGLLVFVMLLITKVPYAGLIAVMIGVGNMVPYVGAIIAMLIGGLLVLIADPTKIWFLIFANFLANQVEGMYLSPKIIGKTVGLTSFWVISGVLIGGAIMGPLGMVFGVPAIGVVKLIYNMRLKNKNEKQ